MSALTTISHQIIDHFMIWWSGESILTKLYDCYLEISASADGVLTPGSVHARPSAQPPIDTSGNFSAHVSAESLFEISPFSGQNRVILGGRGGPRIIFFIGILLFLLLRSPCKVSNSYDMPLLGFSNGGGYNKKKRKNMQNSGLRLSDAVCTAPLGPKTHHSKWKSNNICLWWFLGAISSSHCYRRFFLIHSKLFLAYVIDKNPWRSISSKNNILYRVKID